MPLPSLQLPHLFFVHVPYKKTSNEIKSKIHGKSMSTLILGSLGIHPGGFSVLFPGGTDCL